MDNKQEIAQDPGLRKKPLRLLKRVFRIGFFVGLGLSMIFAGMFGIWLREIGIFSIENVELSSITEHKNIDNTIILDKDGHKIGEVFNRYHVFVPYNKLPKDLVKAIIAIEDRSFFQHHGVDLRGILRAGFDRLKGSRLKQGASTITQQLVRNFLLSREKSLERKIKEAVLAIKLETKISKQEILQLYANAFFLGNGAYGVGAAAQRYFGRDLESLEPHELALIAGLFQSPSRYNPQRFPKRAKVRQKQVLRAMYESGMITKSKMDAYDHKPLNYQTYHSVNSQLAPYFIDHVQERAVSILGRGILNKGLRIHTTLDSALQKMSNQTMVEKKDVFKFAYRMVLIPFENKGQNPKIQGAILSANPQTGAIVSMVGGRNYNQTKFNRAIQSKRQPGSAFKPIIYSLALASGMKWSDLIYVSPVAINNYRPKNFSKQFLTEVTMLGAFYKSINTPAVEIGAKLGLKNVLQHAMNLGVETPIRPETGSLLGASEVTMLDMLRVYSTIANKGVRVEPYAIESISDANGKLLYQVPPIKERSTKVLSEQDAYLIMQGLRAVFRHGTAFSENDLGHVAAGKTGTSNDSRDNWFVGFTPNITTAVWVGSDKSFEFLGAATGTSLALPIWAHYMRKAMTIYPPPPFEQPVGIVRQRVHSRFGYATSSGMDMYFKKGQEPTEETSDLKVLSETGRYRTLFEN